MPSISIGMAVYNCEYYIKDSVNSILNQTFTDWELILINDNSSDSTLEIIKTFNDPRIRILNNTERLGLATCLNLCIAFSRGKYFARMDGDDIMFTNRLEIQYQFLLKNSEVDVVGCNAIIIDHENNIIGDRISVVSNCITDMLNNGGLFIHPSIIGKTSWFKKYHYNELFLRCQDLELWARTMDHSNFKIINSYLIFYRDLEDIKIKKYILVGKYYRKILKLNKHKIRIFFYHMFKIKTYLKVFYYYINFIVPRKSISKINDYEYFFNELKKAIR